MNKKRLILAFGLIVMVLACAVLFYRLTYPIKLHMGTLDWETSEYLKHEDGLPRNVKFLGKGLVIDDIEYYLINVDEQFGYVRLEKGPFGRHRILNVGYGDGLFRKGIVDINDKKYLLFAGLDSLGAIDKITIEIQGSTYELSTGTYRPFLACMEIDAHTTKEYVDLDKITLYDENGNDITANYDLSGGTFN